MITLHRNSKGELVDAPGLRTRTSSLYSPNSPEPYRLSRSKFNDFLSCQRCFYLDRVKGLVSPSTPGWTLNQTTDDLLKREFDECRAAHSPHRTFEAFGLGHVVPFEHPDIERWRDSLHGGLEYAVPSTNIVLHGGIDDIWMDTISEQLIVVDYKSQATKDPVSADAYLRGVYHQGYKVQIDFYANLLTKMGFNVASTGYFFVCNADKHAPGFFGNMRFDETIVPYRWNSDWIGPKISEMIQLLSSSDMPDPTPACEACAYARERSLLEA